MRGRGGGADAYESSYCYLNLMPPSLIADFYTTYTIVYSNCIRSLFNIHCFLSMNIIFLNSVAVALIAKANINEILDRKMQYKGKDSQLFASCIKSYNSCCHTDPSPPSLVLSVEGDLLRFSAQK